MKRWKAILFDLDGTLLNTSEGVISSVRYTLESLNYAPLTDEQLLTFIGPPLNRRMKAIYGISDEEALKVMDFFRAHYGGDDLLKSHAYAGMPEFLESLRKKGYQLGVATYKREDMAKRVLEHCGVASYFDSICGSDAAGKYSKTDVIRNCLRALNVSEPSDAVLIGDSDNDAIGAGEAGLDFIGVTYGFGFHSREDVEKFPVAGIAETVEELRDLF